MGERLKSATPAEQVLDERYSDPTTDLGLQNLARRQRAAGGGIDIPGRRAEEPPPFTADDAKLLLRELALFALPAGGIGLGARAAGRILPKVGEIVGRKSRHVAELADQAVMRARKLQEAARHARTPSGQAFGRKQARQAGQLADDLGLELRRLIGREARVAGGIRQAGQLAGGAAGGAASAIAVNTLDPDERQSVAVNTALGALGPLAARPLEALAKSVARLVAGVPGQKARGRIIAFDRMLERTREAGREARTPGSGANVALSLGRGGERELARDFALKRISPSSGIELTNEQGKRLGGTLNSMRLSDRLGSAGTAGALAWILSPFDAAASAVTAATAAYLITPKIRQVIISKALRSDRFADWMVNILPRQSSTDEILTSLGAIYAVEEARDVRDAIGVMIDDIAELGSELARAIEEGAGELTDDMRRELDQLRLPTPGRDER